MNTRAASATISLLAAAALLAACGGGGDDTASAGAGDESGDEIATLGTTPEDDTADVTGTAADGSSPGSTDVATEDPEEAMEQFSECMREHGVDFPDPPAPGEAQAVAVTIAPGDEDNMQEAQEACGHLMENVRGEMELDPEQQAEMQAEMLEFTECMRDQGIEMADPEFAEDGGVMINMSSGTADEEQAGGPPVRDDEEFQAAMEVCGGPGEGGVFTVEEGAGAND